MSAVGHGAEHHGAVEAQLGPAGLAVFAHPTTLVVVIHHALANAGLAFGDGRADGCHHTAGFMACNDGLGTTSNPT
jgi:hypothetical protein